jgi:hypothetical protein
MKDMSADHTMVTTPPMLKQQGSSASKHHAQWHHHFVEPAQPASTKRDTRAAAAEPARPTGRMRHVSPFLNLRTPLSIAACCATNVAIFVCCFHVTLVVSQSLPVKYD